MQYLVWFKRPDTQSSDLKFSLPWRTMAGSAQVSLTSFKHKGLGEEAERRQERRGIAGDRLRMTEPRDSASSQRMTLARAFYVDSL